MRLPGFLVAALLLTVPTAALAAPGIVTTDVSMRAGPGAGFPVVDRIPGGAHVNIHGCIRGNAWCDVSWDGDRGWVSADALEYFYRNRYVYLPEYADEIDVPIVTFVLSSYWANYYAGRPWYHRRAYWANYWQSHARFATQLPSRGSRSFAATQVRTREGRFANVRGARVTSERARVSSERFANVRGARVTSERARVSSERFANVRGARVTSERFARTNVPRGAISRGTISGMRPPVAAQQRATRFSAMPHAAPVARPNVGRVGGPPLQAHGQMGAPRAMGAAPNAGAGGGPRIGGAPQAGGGAPHAGGGSVAGPRGGGGPGRPQH
jgi:uncharacterized protein YraI